MPTTQDSHNSDGATLNDPVLQAVQTVAEVQSVQFALQSLQFSLASLYLPATHKSQIVVPTLFSYPTLQDVQAVKLVQA